MFTAPIKVTFALICVVFLWCIDSNVDPRANITTIVPDLVPFLNCTINDGTTCTAVWGYANGHGVTITTTLSNNKFSPAPIYRGQPGVFFANTVVHRAFNNSRPCSSGNLSWTLRDPITGISRTVTAGTALGNTCTVPTVPLTCESGNTALVAQRLQDCQADCGTQCSYCGQVYSYCQSRGSISSNFTIQNCVIVELGFNPVSQGCDYLQELDRCCLNVGPPVEPPVVVPVSPPLEPPVAPPVSVPIFDCTDNDPILTALETCQAGCSNCTNCAQVYSICLGLDFFVSNDTLNACMTAALQSFSTSAACPFGSSIIDCCEPVVPPVVEPLAPPVVEPVSPPVVEPVAPPSFTPPSSAYCPMPDDSYLQALACVKTQTGPCTFRTSQPSCAAFVEAMANSTTVRDCLFVGFNTSTDAINCNFDQVVQSCCNPSSTALCPVNLGRAENATLYTRFGIDTLPPLQIIGNLVFYGPYDVPFGANVSVTGLTITNDVQTSIDIQEAIIAIKALPNANPWNSTNVATTYTPGVYSTTSKLTIGASVTITFDAQSDPYAVFVFFAQKTITIGSNVAFNLINGAHSSNIFIATTGAIQTRSGVNLQGNFLKVSDRTRLRSLFAITGRLLSSEFGVELQGALTPNTITTLPAVSNPEC